MIASRGIVHGKTIELTDAPGLADGAEVQVFIRPTSADLQQRAEIVRRYAAQADDWSTEEDDRILAELAADRQQSGQRDLPE
jgi:hypothetical protein